MKTKIQSLCIVLACFCSTISIAQATYSNEELDQLYWTYRNRYKLYFTHIGGRQGGDCIPISARLDKTTDNTWCEYPKGYISYGDGTSNLGFYIALLATEYKLLKDANQPVKEVLNELYYTIRTVRRLDDSAEKYYNPLLTNGVLNGFFLRDDVDSATHLHWQKNNTAMTAADAYEKRAKDPGGNCKEEKFMGPAPEMSKDQFACLLMGFYMVKQLVVPDLLHDIFVQPTPADDGFSLLAEMQVITHRYMQFIFTDVIVEENESECASKKNTFIRNLLIVNPVNNHYIGTERGGDVKDMIWHLSKAANKITGFDYSALDYHARRETFNSNCQSNGVEEIWSRVSNMAANPSALALSVLAMVNREAGENNSNIFCPLAIVNEAWDETEFKFLCNGLHFFEYYLLYSVANNRPDMKDFNFWKERLSTVGKETNPYRYDWGNYYRHANSIQHSNRPSTDEPDGYLNGIDFMLAYNLFKIKYGADNNLALSKEESCDCGAPLVERSWSRVIAPGDTQRGIWNWTNPTLKISSQFDGMGNTQNILSTGTFTIERYHPDYAEKGIKTYSYLSLHDYFVRNSAVLHAKGDVALCNQKTLYVDNTGKLIVGGDLPHEISEFRVRKGASLFVVGNSELIIKNNSRLIIEPGGLLLVCDNAKVTLSGTNAVLEVQGAISVGMNATFKPEGTGYVLFNNYNPQINGPYSITNEAGGGKVEFIGIGGSKEIEIASYTNMLIQDHIPFKMYDMTAECGFDAGFKLGCPVSIELARFNKLPGIPIFTVPFTNQVIGKYVHNGLTFYGQPDIIVRQCSFNNARTAIKNIKLPSAGKKIKVLYSDFNTCERAIETFNGGGNFAGNRFTACKVGWTDPKTATTTILEHNLFTNTVDHAISINTLAGTTGIFGNVFKDNKGTIRASGYAYLFLACNQFYNNSFNGLYNNSVHLSASTMQPFHQLFINGSGVNAGNNIFTTGIQSNQSGIRFSDMTYYRFDDGFNRFNNMHISNPPYSYSINADLKRKVVFPGGSGAGDLYFNNNSFSPAPALMTSGLLDVNNNAISRQFDLKFTDFGPGGYIYGTQTLTAPTCPVRWQDAVSNPSLFNNYDLMMYEANGSFPLVKSPSGTGSGSGPGRVHTNTLPSTPTIVSEGVYSGTNYKQAAITALNSVYTGTENADGMLVNLEGLSNLGNLVLVTIGLPSETDKYIWSYLYKSYNGYLSEAVYTGAFVHSTILAEQYLTSTIMIDIAALNNNDLVNAANEPLHYASKLSYKYNSATAYAEFGYFDASLATLDHISAFVKVNDVSVLNTIRCITENEKKLSSHEITRLQFEQYTGNCMMSYTDHISTELRALSDTTYEDSTTDAVQPSYVIYPNPASMSATVTVNIPSGATITISVYNKFGLKVMPDQLMGFLPAGQHTATVNLASLSPDVYTMIVTIRDIPYTQHFLKL